MADNITSTTVVQAAKQLGIGGTPVDTALVDMQSTNQGLLVPRMTSTQRDLIVNPATSLMIYNTTTAEFEYFNSTWQAVGAGGSGITQLTGDVTAGPGTGSQAATLASTAVTPASYTFTSLTVDAKGRITAASSGTPVSSLHADANSNITGAVQLVSGTNVTLSQVGQAITITASGGSSATVQAYTPTISACGTPTNVSFFYKTDGVSVDVWGTFKSGTVSGSTFAVTVPVNIATSHLSANFCIIGDMLVVDSGSVPVFMFYDGSTAGTVYGTQISAGTGGQVASKVAANTIINTGDYISVKFNYPIA